MFATDVAIIGAGQAGLAMSRCLARRGIDHMIFERGGIGASWRLHAWDSLRLLTPNWLNGLPDSPYGGNAPDEFMPHGEFLARLQAYGREISAPVMVQTAIVRLTRDHGAFQLCADRGTWKARAVVIATGQCDVPLIPESAGSLNWRVLSLHSSQYRSPHTLPPGGIVVVGASASGVQIADELRRCGRDVTIAVGRHTRMPRLWRGRDIFWWMHQTGMLTERTRDLGDPEAAKRQPAGQLAGRPDHSNVDLASLQALGVRLAGRFSGVGGERIYFADDLPAIVRRAQAKFERLLARIDTFVGYEENCARDVIAQVDLSGEAPRSLDVRSDGIGAVIWATGYRRDFSWLKVPGAITADGEIAHVDGIAPVPGLYALGYRLLRKRDSHFIGGVGSDAFAIAEEISAFLGRINRRAA
jgi:putative flavoprotein involved in K+ transport